MNKKKENNFESALKRFASTSILFVELGHDA